MTKAELRKYYLTDSAIANLFGISRAAVANWEMDKPIPNQRYLQLRYELRPDLFSRITQDIK